MFHLKEETNMNKENGTTPGQPQTPVVQPVVTNGASELGNGKIVDTYCNKSTGHINTSGTNEEYK